MLINTHDTAFGQKQIKLETITNFFKISDWILVTSNNSLQLDKIGKGTVTQNLVQRRADKNKVFVNKSRERDMAQKQFSHGYSPRIKT